MDAGPGLNFFAAKKERLLFSAVGPLCIPETVRNEIQAKASKDERFVRAGQALARIPEKLLAVLPDDETSDLDQVVTRLAGKPMAERMRFPRDLGETMVIAHAVTLAEAGSDITMLIDDGAGTMLAGGEQARLCRMKEQGAPVGSLSIISTVTVLERCVRDGHVEDKGEMRKIYAQFRGLDDGLPPIDKTRLLAKELWSQHKTS